MNNGMDAYINQTDVPPVEHVLRIRFNACQARSLQEMLSSRGCTLAHYVALALHRDLAEFRLARISTLMGFDSVPAVRQADDNIRRRPRRLDPIRVQKILFLHQSENMTIAQLAERFQMPKNSISDILQQRDRVEHVQLPVRGRTRGSRWTHCGRDRTEEARG